MDGVHVIPVKRLRGKVQRFGIEIDFQRIGDLPAVAFPCSEALVDFGLVV